MTNLEAIKLIQNEIQCVKTADSCGRDCGNCPLVKPTEDILEAYALAIEALEALEKQIPRKPMVSIDVYNENLWRLYCPTCGSWVGMHNKRLKVTDMYNNENRKICAKCGRRFDLEVDDG